MERLFLVFDDFFGDASVFSIDVDKVNAFG